MSTLFFRVLNRKQVQDIRLEQLFVEKPAFRLTMLVTHPWPNNYKAQSHPLYIETSNVKFLKELSLFTDAYIAAGFNFKVWLNGNRIRRIEFSAKSFYWDEKSGDRLLHITD